MASAPPSADKRALREAAERIERGIEAYASGDLGGALREFEEALKLAPANLRAQVQAGWVRDLASGKRSLEHKGQLDEDALQAVDHALGDHGDEVRLDDAPNARLEARLDDAPIGDAHEVRLDDGTDGDDGFAVVHGDEDQTREKRHVAIDSPWDPVPLTPSHAEHGTLTEKAQPPSAGTPPPAGSAQSFAQGAPVTSGKSQAPAGFSGPATGKIPAPAGFSGPPTSGKSQMPAELSGPPTGKIPAPKLAPAPNAPSQHGPASSPLTSAPPLHGQSASSPSSSSQATPPSQAAQGQAARPKQKSSSSTLLGITAPNFDGPMLTPVGPRPKGFPVEEQTNSQTREWRQTPTGTNMPPLDVPELTDEQIHELLALDAAPGISLEAPKPAPESLPRTAHSTDPGLGPDPTARILELEAEPTPPPHRNPLPPGARARDPLAPEALPPRPSVTSEFDAFELTPTRERRDLLKAVVQSPTSSEDDLNLLPLEVPRELKGGHDDMGEEGTNPTNPFIKRKLAEYASYAPAPKVDDLPLPPGTRDTGRQKAVDGEDVIQKPLDAGDIEGAFAAAEALVARAGGLESEACVKQQWLLERVYENVIGPSDKVPVHGEASPNLDPRQAFLLSRIDGMSSVDDLLDVSGMPRLEALRCLALLVRRGVVTMK